MHFLAMLFALIMITLVNAQKVEGLHFIKHHIHKDFNTEGVA